MKYSNHVLFATTINIPIILATVEKSNYNLLLILCCCVLIYSLLPDIDEKSSKINNYIPNYFNAFLYCKHRGFTHKPLFIIISPTIALLISYYYLNISDLYTLSIIYIISFISVLSHSIGDGMTIYGVPNFIGNYHLYTLPKGMRFASGSKNENRFIFYIYIILLIELLYLKNTFFN